MQPIIIQTYATLFAGLVSYFVGGFLDDVSIAFTQVAIVMTFVMLFAVMNTKNIYTFLIFCFTVGISHNFLFGLTNTLDPGLIHSALTITMVIFAGLTVIAFMAYDFNTFAIGSMLYSALCTLLFMQIFQIFTNSTAVESITIFLSIIIFSGYTVYDTQNILAQPEKTATEHALGLFLDFVNMFLDILRLLGKGKRTERETKKSK